MARNNVCVFCASGDHVPSIFKECARQLGFLCAKKGIGIVNGAGNMAPCLMPVSLQEDR